MQQCQKCGKTRIYSLNYIFSKLICNDCYLIIKEKAKK